MISSSFATTFSFTQGQIVDLHVAQLTVVLEPVEESIHKVQVPR